MAELNYQQIDVEESFVCMECHKYRICHFAKEVLCDHYDKSNCKICFRVRK